jgi:hypothetical protein
MDVLLPAHLLRPLDERGLQMTREDRKRTPWLQDLNFAAHWEPLNGGARLVFAEITALITVDRRTRYTGSIISKDVPPLHSEPFAYIEEAKEWCEACVRFLATDAALRQEVQAQRQWLRSSSEEVARLREALLLVEQGGFQSRDERHSDTQKADGKQERSPHLPWYTLPPRLIASPEAFKQWLVGKTTWLTAKRKREQEYLDSRVWKQQHQRGKRTQTDELYERDAPHEEELLFLLAELAAVFYRCE